MYFVLFLIASVVQALYPSDDAAAPDVPKIKPTLIYSTKKIAQVKKGRDIYKLTGSCKLDNVFTKDWFLLNG